MLHVRKSKEEYDSIIARNFIQNIYVIFINIETMGRFVGRNQEYGTVEVIYLHRNDGITFVIQVLSLAHLIG